MRTIDDFQDFRIGEGGDGEDNTMFYLCSCGHESEAPLAHCAVGVAVAKVRGETVPPLKCNGCGVEYRITEDVAEKWTKVVIEHSSWEKHKAAILGVQNNSEDLASTGKFDMPDKRYMTPEEMADYGHEQTGISVAPDDMVEWTEEEFGVQPNDDGKYDMHHIFRVANMQAKMRNDD